MEYKQANITSTKNSFDTERENFFTGINGNNAIIKDFGDGKNYWLLTYEFSGADGDTPLNPNFKTILEEEYKVKVEKAGEYISNTIDNFDNVITKNKDDVKQVVSSILFQILL